MQKLMSKCSIIAGFVGTIVQQSVYSVLIDMIRTATLPYGANIHWHADASFELLLFIAFCLT